MNKYNLSEFKGGWFIGNFEPSILKNENFEVAVKYYKAGDRDKRHVHKVAKEFTFVASGIVSFNGNRVVAGEIVEILQNEPNQFEAITDAVIFVVKTPSIKSDKYMI